LPVAAKKPNKISRLVKMYWRVLQITTTTKETGSITGKDRTPPRAKMVLVPKGISAGGGRGHMEEAKCGG